MIDYCKSPLDPLDPIGLKGQLRIQNFSDAPIKNFSVLIWWMTAWHLCEVQKHLNAI